MALRTEFTEEYLRRVHAWTKARKYDGIGGTLDEYDDVPEPKHEHMSVRIGNSWHSSWLVYDAIYDLNTKSALDSLTTSDYLLGYILNDNQMI